MSAVRSKTATIHDVARQAGVSYQTVSRVLNDHAAVASATRAKVLDAMRALDYRPNHAARTLAGRRGNTLGVLVYGARHYGPMQMLASVEDAARARGYGVKVAFAQDLAPDSVLDAVQTLRDNHADGAVLITPLHQVESARLDELLGGLPFVLVDAEPTTDRPVVAIDRFAGGRASASHLVTLGHRRVLVLRGPHGWYDATLRHQGVLSVLGATDGAVTVTAEGDWSASSGYDATRAAFTRGEDVTAVLAANDQMALGALRALRERGLRVPEDVSVVGFDDVPEAAFYHPPLTTVRQDFKALGTASLERLIDLIDHPGRPTSSSVLVPALVVRASTAPPRP